VVGLLKYLGVSKADFFGESYGANATAMIAVRYPKFVRRVATYAATFRPPSGATGWAPSFPQDKPLKIQAK